MVRKTRKRKRKKIARRKTSKKKLSLKRSVKAFGRLILKHLVEEPEKEREQTIAALEREMAKKFKRLGEGPRGRK